MLLSKQLSLFAQQANELPVELRGPERPDPLRMLVELQARKLLQQLSAAVGRQPQAAGRAGWAAGRVRT